MLVSPLGGPLHLSHKGPPGCPPLRGLWQPSGGIRAHRKARLARLAFIGMTSMNFASGTRKCAVRFAPHSPCQSETTVSRAFSGPGGFGIPLSIQRSPRILKDHCLLFQRCARFSICAPLWLSRYKSRLVQPLAATACHRQQQLTHTLPGESVTL